MGTKHKILHCAKTLTVTHIRAAGVLVLIFLLPKGISPHERQMFLLRKKMLTRSFLVAHPSWVVVFMVLS